MATKEAAVDAVKDDVGGGAEIRAVGAQIRGAAAATDLGADVADLGGATGSGHELLAAAATDTKSKDKRSSKSGRKSGKDKHHAATDSNDWMQIGSDFVKEFYNTLDTAPMDVHKLYNKKCEVKWNILDDSHHMVAAEEIQKKMSANQQANFRLNDHHVQKYKRALHIVAKGVCTTSKSCNFVQSFLVHSESRLILKDVLHVVQDVSWFRFKLKQSLIIGEENTHNDESSAARTRIYVKSSIPTRCHESQPRKGADGKSVAILYDERMMNHKPDFHCVDDIRMIQHKDPSTSAIELPERISSIMAKLYEDNLMDRVALVEVDFASLDDVLAVHDADYGDFIHCLPPNPTDIEKYIGYNSADMFCSDGTRDAVFLAAGAAIKAAELVYTGHYEKAFAVIRPPGHHAGKSEAEGFCYCNNLAIAAQNLIRKHGVKKIAAVDWDVHHGNGTQELFYSSDEVLFFSSFNKHLHYPQTMKQSAEHIGKGKGAGFNVNVPLRRNFGDSDMLYIWDELLLPLLEEFQPEIILVSCGYDAAENDMGGASVSPSCYGMLLDKLIKSGNGKVVLILEGGYELPILSSCAAHCVRVMTGDSKARLKEDDRPAPLPPKTTRDTVESLKHLLSRKWKVFKAQGY